MPRLLALFILVLLWASCKQEYTPKPKAYFRVDFPEKSYEVEEQDCPFSYEQPAYARLSKRTEYCWYDLEYSSFSAKLHMSYKAGGVRLKEHLQAAHELAYKHSRVAEAIVEHPYENPEDKVYGIVYDYEGKTATAMQFYLTDSSDHFVRGALYFNTEMSDSLLPMANFLKTDVYRMVESWSWK